MTRRSIESGRPTIGAAFAAIGLFAVAALMVATALFVAAGVLGVADAPPVADAPKIGPTLNRKIAAPAQVQRKSEPSMEGQAFVTPGTSKRQDLQQGRIEQVSTAQPPTMPLETGDVATTTQSQTPSRVVFSGRAPRGTAGCTGYRTYDPRTQTYRGFDGQVHDCRLSGKTQQ
jgi:hypothetical protein